MKIYNIQQLYEATLKKRVAAKNMKYNAVQACENFLSKFEDCWKDFKAEKNIANNNLADACREFSKILHDVSNAEVTWEIGADTYKETTGIQTPTEHGLYDFISGTDSVINEVENPAGKSIMACLKHGRTRVKRVNDAFYTGKAVLNINVESFCYVNISRPIYAPKDGSPDTDVLSFIKKELSAFAEKLQKQIESRNTFSNDTLKKYNMLGVNNYSKWLSDNIISILSNNSMDGDRWSDGIYIRQLRCTYNVGCLLRLNISGLECNAGGDSTDEETIIPYNEWKKPVRYEKYMKTAETTIRIDFNDKEKFSKTIYEYILDLFKQGKLN